MRNGKKILTVIGIFILVIGGLIIYWQTQKYQPAAQWFQQHEAEVNRLIAGGDDNALLSWCERQAAVHRVSVIGDRIWRLVFQPWEPETTEELIISADMFTEEWVKEYLRSDFLNGGQGDEIAEALFSKGYWRATGIGAPREKDGGYAEIEMIRENCLRCKACVPT